MFGNKFERLVSLLLVFLIPTQLAIHFWPSYAFVYGIRVDYLAPTIYLTDILIFLLLTPWLLGKPKLSKYTPLIVIFAITNISSSIIPPVALFRWFKIFEFVLFGLYLKDRKKQIGEKTILDTFLVSSVIFSAIGIIQFLTNNSLGKELYYLGARNFNVTTPGIALTIFFGQLHLRAYSTFPHPNALAGFLGAGLLIILGRKVGRGRYFYMGVIFIAACFILTYSLSAVVGMVVVAFFYFFPKLKKRLLPFGLIFSLILPFMTFFERFGKSFSERVGLAQISMQVIQRNYFLGVGLGNFVIASSSHWILQPVHNIFLLLFSELGVGGVLLGVLIFYKSLRHRFFLVATFVLVTSLFDHYWLTSQQNLLLLSLAYAVLN